MSLGLPQPVTCHCCDLAHRTPLLEDRVASCNFTGVSMRVQSGSLALLAAGFAVPLSGQSAVSAGITTGTARFNSARSEQAVTAIVQVRPRPWLSLSAIPSFVHVTDSVAG